MIVQEITVPEWLVSAACNSFTAVSPCCRRRK